MELTVQDERDMTLMGRKDYTVRAHYEGATPPRAKLRDALAKQVKAKDDLVILRRIRPVFGDSASVIEASVYADQDSLEKYEPTYIRARHEKEAPAEEPAAESEKSEESPEESAEKSEEPAESEDEESKDDEEPEEKSAEDEKPEEKGEDA